MQEMASLPAISTITAKSNDHCLAAAPVGLREAFRIPLITTGRSGIGNTLATTLAVRARCDYNLSGKGQ
jgi:hypothetical protein